MGRVQFNFEKLLLDGDLSASRPSAKCGNSDPLSKLHQFQAGKKSFRGCTSTAPCLQLIMISAQQGMTYGYLVMQNSFAQLEYFAGQKNYVTLH